MKNNYLGDIEMNEIDFLNPDGEIRLFALQLVSAIAKGDSHISITLTDKGAVAFAHELSEYILTSKLGQSVSFEMNNHTFLSRKQVMDILSVSSTTLWLWNKKGYLVHIKRGNKVFYHVADINNLRQGKEVC